MYLFNLLDMITKFYLSKVNITKYDTINSIKINMLDRQCLLNVENLFDSYITDVVSIIGVAP